MVLQAPIARLAPVAPFVLQRLRSVSRCLQWWEIGGRNEASRQLSTLAKAERWPSIIIMDHCSEIQHCCFPKSEDWNAQMHQFCQSLVLSQLKWPGSRPYPDIAIWPCHSDWVAMAGQTTNHQWSSNSLAWKGGWMDWRIFTTFSLAACTLDYINSQKIEQQNLTSIVKTYFSISLWGFLQGNHNTSCISKLAACRSSYSTAYWVSPSRWEPSAMALQHCPIPSLFFQWTQVIFPPYFQICLECAVKTSH